MGTSRSVVKKDSPEWLRCQHAIRKLILATGRDALVYAKGSMEHEDSEPERLKVFWDNARRYFDEYEMPAPPKSKPKPVPQEPAPQPQEQVPVAVPEPPKEA